ncbi:hypothetical protein H4R35_006414 [Dimargaris xerosporica]|nr:hypothetical protein H4R35_006414 [Dimargaris xerosporica]
MDTVVDLMCDIHEEDVQEDLGPYWTRSLSMRSPLLADNHVLLSTLDPKVLQEQTPFLSMLVDTQSFYKFDANLPALINLMVHLAAPPSASVLPGAALGYWIWKDILKVAVLYNNVKVVEITLKHMPDVYKAWYSNTYYAYYDQFNSNDDLEWPLESMKDDDDRKNDLIKDMLEEGHVAVTNASTSFYMWQRALFWTWAIALGHNEVRDVLEPKGEEWTTDHYKRLTTIMCQKQVAKVCDYLTHVKGYNYIPDDNINFDQMPFAQKLRELPNPYLNWDISDPQKVWVAAPEESVPMPQ